MNITPDRTQQFQISNNCLDIVKQFEDCILKPYRDPHGVIAIGHGSVCYENGIGITFKDEPITEERAEQLLKHTLKHYEHFINLAIRREINQNQFDALVSLCYDIGINMFRGSKLLYMLDRDKDNPEISKQFMNFNKLGNYKMEKLSYRRQLESKLYFKK